MGSRVGSLLLLTLIVGFSLTARADGEQPDVVFILLDTTRADRLSAWGYERDTTPNLDALARRGVRFARHFANSHATRPSMPQLMSGRYYLPNILREFRPTSHPRDWRFNRHDDTIALLPELLRAGGYRLEAVSAHPWVSRSSRFGEPFDAFDEPEPSADRGHVEADVLVDQGIARWRDQPHKRPLFLYLHFMDAHIPRFVPPGALLFGPEPYAARRRFDAAGEPMMDDPWHQWDRSDARAFRAEDVAFFGDVYDTVLARMDEQLGRLLDTILEDDPDLRNTLVVVVADHGEELAEHGRISHEASLDDAVQHIPWMLTGWRVASGQVAWGLTENIDVVPTLVDLLGLPRPRGVRFDGHSMLQDGEICDRCLRSTVAYAWEDYRAIRLGSRLLRDSIESSFRSVCNGRFGAFGPTRTPLPGEPDVLRSGAVLLSERLDVAERRFKSERFGAPTEPFSIPPAFWGLDESNTITCVEAGPDTPRRAFTTNGWIWTGRGLTIQRLQPSTEPLRLRLDVPAGRYRAEIGVRELPPPPRFFGYRRWLRKFVRRRTAKARLPIGDVTAAPHGLILTIPPTLVHGRHMLSVHLTPHTYSRRDQERSSRHDPSLRRRLQSLGYIE